MTQEQEYQAIEATVKWLRKCVSRGYVPGHADVRRYAKKRWRWLDADQIEAATAKRSDW